MGRERYEYGPASRAEELARRRRRRNPSVTEMVQAGQYDPDFEPMQDEGDMLAPRPVISGRTIIKCVLAAAVIYVLLVSALVLLK